MAIVPGINGVDFLCEEEVIVCFADGKLARFSAEELYVRAVEEADLEALGVEPERD